MTDTHSSRQLVLARLGTPAAQLPGESYRHSAPTRERIYARYGEYIDMALLEDRPEQALEEFLVFLEAERERDYEAFHYGRELLVADLYDHIEYPSSDPDPQPVAPPLIAVARQKLPRWSRRKPARDRPGCVKPQQLRARVLERLGWPHGFVPGECTLLTDSSALDEVRIYFDQFDYLPITESLVDDAIERLVAMREREWQAFCYGRNELLSLLPITVDLPTPASEARACA